MSSIWERVKSLFEQVDQSSVQEPVVHELISRSASQQDFAENFQLQIVYRKMKEWINDQYLLFENDSQQKDNHLQFLSGQSLKGFIIYFNETNYQEKEIVAFFDLLKSKILTLGYYGYVSDFKSFVENGEKKRVERHYLKPSLRGKGDRLLPQYFGNINIELIIKNNAIQYLKFGATTYSDRLYKEAKPFSELIMAVTAS